MKSSSRQRVVYFLSALSLLHPGECFTTNVVVSMPPKERRLLHCTSHGQHRHHERKQGYLRQDRQLRMTTGKDGDELSNEVDTASSSTSYDELAQQPSIYIPRNLGDVTREFIRNLAQLSLEDYKWRSGVFKAMTADRLLETSLARMRGDSAPGYYRPMDAPFVGPLGRAENSAVSWLLGVIEEEGRRAQLIYDQNGILVRPMEVDDGHGGPLAEIESRVVHFFNTIRESEQLRKSLGILRPKDMEESQRGPLGNAEFRLYHALKDLSNSETLRLEQSLKRGTSVRPMDVPGPLGEVEAAVFEIFKAERKRAAEKSQSKSLRPLRPKDATVPGPLGDAEQEAMRAFQRLSEEERERLRGILKALENNRPMEVSRNSILGALESIIVGIVRAPQMLASVWDRVAELLKSEPIPLTDDAKARLKPPSVTTIALRIPDDTDDDLGAFE